jgi:hypothetical protein
MLTPSVAIFSYYSDEECMHEINFDNLTFDNDDRNIYFKFKKFLNKFGEILFT